MQKSKLTCNFSSGKKVFLFGGSRTFSSAMSRQVQNTRVSFEPKQQAVRDRILLDASETNANKEKADQGRRTLDDFLSGSLRLCVAVPDVIGTDFFVVKKYLAC